MGHFLKYPEKSRNVLSGCPRVRWDGDGEEFAPFFQPQIGANERKLRSQSISADGGGRAREGSSWISFERPPPPPPAEACAIRVYIYRSRSTHLSPTRISSSGSEREDYLIMDGERGTEERSTVIRAGIFRVEFAERAGEKLSIRKERVRARAWDRILVSS